MQLFFLKLKLFTQFCCADFAISYHFFETFLLLIPVEKGQVSYNTVALGYILVQKNNEDDAYKHTIVLLRLLRNSFQDHVVTIRCCESFAQNYTYRLTLVIVRGYKIVAVE